MITIDGWAIDAFLTEQHTLESEVTQYPVESGSKKSDHIRPLPLVVQVEGIVTNTPLEANGNGLEIPATEIFERLVAIRDAREPVTINTSKGSYENMAMQSLQIPVDARTGDALRFTATFQQVQVVIVEKVKLQVPIALNKQNKGHKASIEGPLPGTSLDGVRNAKAEARNVQTKAQLIKRNPALAVHP